jgi:1,4-alpha-glucan branching enzyme
MGNEIAQGLEWNHRAELDWYLLQYDSHKGVQNLFRDLNRLHRDEPALHQRDSDASGFRWINHDDAANCVFSLIRLSNGDDFVIAVTNMTAIPHDHYRIGVPNDGQYKVILNTDSHHYGGSNYDAGDIFQSINEPANGMPFTLDIKVPPMATIYIKYNF